MMPVPVCLPVADRSLTTDINASTLAHSGNLIARVISEPPTRDLAGERAFIFPDFQLTIFAVPVCTLGVRVYVLAFLPILP